jgi:nucleotide-binding universal stress UspA family protein
MRAVIWVTEASWQSCIDQARAVVGEQDLVTIVHVSSSDVEEFAGSGRRGLLGRPAPRQDPRLAIREVADEEAEALLSAARERLGLDAGLQSRRGHVEREVLEACADADMLILTRDGERSLEPKSLGRFSRFVVDHAPCAVVLLWAGPPPALESIRWPPHLR